MKNEEIIEIRVAEQARRQLMNRITQAHISGLDEEKLIEYGFYDRISLLLTGMFTLQAVAYRLYGGAWHLLELIGATKKHEIRIACNAYQQAFDRFLDFWSNYYMKADGAKMEMNNESESLYHQFMRWAQLPESWSLGEPLRTDESTDSVIEYDAGDYNTVLKFYTSVIDSEIIDEDEETWMVTRYNRNENKGVVVEENLGKADAQMIAKRLSDNDRENIYLLSKIRQYTEKKKEAIPVKVFKANQLVGDIRKVIKHKS